MDRPQYLNWIVKEDGVVFEDQQPLNCYRLSYEIDEDILSDWALHIRRHYVPDDELEEDAILNELTVEEYLRQYVVPQKEENFGPTARSNDISEILFADLFEFVLNYEVPRCKQYNRSGKNESEHGTDVLAYRFFVGPKKPHKNDELVAIEVKALLSSKEASKVIKDAVGDSKKNSVELLASRFGEVKITPYETLYTFPTVLQLANADDQDLVECKLGYRVPYIKDAITKVMSGRVDLATISGLSDSEILKKLTALRGIGTWTAKMYLIFVLDRQDILPFEDGAFLQSYRWLYNTTDTTPASVKKKCAKWKPYSSIAARYLYRILDLGLTKEDFHLFK